MCLGGKCFVICPCLGPNQLIRILLCYVMTDAVKANSRLLVHKLHFSHDALIKLTVSLKLS